MTQVDKSRALPLRTRRLTLDAMTEDHAAALRNIVTTPSVGRMLMRFPSDWSLDAARAFIHDTRFRGAPPFRLGVFLDNRLVGSVGVGPGTTPEIYYFLAPDTQGRGLAREALTAFFAFLFDTLGFKALQAEVFHVNPASAHILQTLGFVQTGTGQAQSAARLEPAPISLYRLTADEFRAAT